ncbi:MarR family winged helix-turn-helix transcriptional regulator [Kordiimonas sp.]|uniref:MarR family winged helix-turn-helix transcriptional regulator n=1 Tax=Kordiimonas sp. TaxID=1970157 RepID=UPI003B52741E
MSHSSSTLKEVHQVAWARMFRASQSILEAVEAELKKHKLPPLSWYDLLLELNRAGPGGLRPYELQSAMLIRQYSMSRLLSRAEGDQLISRSNCDNDGRGQVVVITAEGRAMLKKMWPIYRSVLEKKIGSKLRTAETEELSKILQTLL